MIKKKRRPKFNKRTKSLQEKLKLFVFSVAIISTIILAVWSILKVMESPFLKADVGWTIDKNLPITQDLLQQSIQSLVQDKYQFNVHAIKQILESQPWVAKVQIDNQWFSNDIQIEVISQQIAMRWENIDCKTKQSDCKGYISNTGELFIPKKSVMSRAPLARSKAKQNIITQLYQDYLTYQKQAGAMQIKSFSKTHIDKLTFAPDIHVVLGYQQKQKRLLRFLKVYKKLQNQQVKMQNLTFDMRYPKGFTIKYH